MKTKKIEEIVPRLTAECRRKILIKLLVNETLDQKEKWQSLDETLKYEDVKPLSSAADTAGISPNQYRSCLKGEATPSIETIEQALKAFSKTEQADIILDDLVEGLYLFKEIFDREDFILLKKEENQSKIRQAQRKLTKKEGDNLELNLRFWEIELTEYSLDAELSQIWEYLDVEDEQSFEQTLVDKYQWPRLRRIFGDMMEENMVKWLFTLEDLLDKSIKDFISSPFCQDIEPLERKVAVNMLLLSNPGFISRIVLEVMKRVAKEPDVDDTSTFKQAVHEVLKQTLTSVGEFAEEGEFPEDLFEDVNGEQKK